MLCTFYGGYCSLWPNRTARSLSRAWPSLLRAHNHIGGATAVPLHHKKCLLCSVLIYIVLDWIQRISHLPPLKIVGHRTETIVTSRRLLLRTVGNHCCLSVCLISGHVGCLGTVKVNSHALVMAFRVCYKVDWGPNWIR